MNFLSKVTYNDRMTALEYDLFNKMCRITGVTPDRYEIVLMVDADTKVMSDSVPLMVNTMKNDTSIMGLCGKIHRTINHIYNFK
jgi:chitin synthase